MQSSTTNIDSSLFFGNFISANSETTTEGGAFYIIQSSCTLTDCHFEGNYATSTQINSISRGGAISSKNSDFYFFECEFINNSIQSQSQYGGSILLNESNLLVACLAIIALYLQEELFILMKVSLLLRAVISSTTKLLKVVTFSTSSIVMNSTCQ